MAKSYDELFLETDEEVTSVIEKIKKSKKTNIALILPRNAVLGQSIVNLKLIYRQAHEIDKSVTVISPDTVARNLADRVGFSVAESADNAEFSEIESPKAEPETPPVEIEKKRFDNRSEEKSTLPEGPASEPETAEDETENLNQDARDENLGTNELAAPGAVKKIAEDEESQDAPVDAQEPEERVAKTADSKPKGFGGGMIPTRGNLRMYRNQKRRPLLITSVALIGLGVLGLVIAAVVIPKANVKLTVLAQPFNDTITSTVSTAAQALDVEKGIVPGKLQTVTQQTKVSAKATGKKDQGAKAIGTVTVINAWDSLPHTFSAATVLTAKNGNQYVLKAEVTVPGATSTISGGTSTIVPGQKTAAVEAAEPGDSYNISATSLTIPSLPKAQQDKIYATSSATFTGGTSNIVTVVAEGDVSKLNDAARAQNRDEANAKFKTDLSDQVIIERAIQVKTQESSSNFKVDEVTDSIEVTVSGTFELITFLQTDHKQLLEKLLANKIPQGQTLVTQGSGVDIDTSSFEVNLVTESKIDLVTTIHAFTVAGFDQGSIRRALIAGKPTSDTVVALVKEKLPVKSAEITLTPAWWPRLPLWADKIAVELIYTGKE